MLEGAVRGLPRANALGSFLGAAAQAPAALRDDTAFARLIALADSVPQQERVEVLGAISSVRGPHGPLLYTAWLRALNGLQFDDQRVRVLFGMVGGWMATSAYTADAIELVGGLESPADRARVLLAVPATRIPDPAVRA
ncbi:MAG TPA: hypothetical protein VFH27_08120, partial [Longimicrobiaceae bacterium]|nr:hypothetical protein [Longimicrobiaceae bacterium]